MRTEFITREWREAGSFADQLNLYGFWDEYAFLTKGGDLGSALRVGGLDFESLDQAGRDYAVKRLEAAFRSLDTQCRLYQIFFKRNRPAMVSGHYHNPLVRAAMEQRMAFLESKSNRLFAIEIYWVLMVDGRYARTSLLQALAGRSKSGGFGWRDIEALFSGAQARTLLAEEIERHRLRLGQKVNSLIGQLRDLTKVELLGAERTYRLFRRLVNFRPSKIEEAPLNSPLDLDRQVCDSELEAHRGHLAVDGEICHVLTLKELPGETRPLVLAGLLDVPANFHVVTEWHPVEGAQARREIAKRRRHYHNTKTSFLSNLQDREKAGPQDELVDDAKQAAVAELGNALTAVGLEGRSFGEFSLSVVVYDLDGMKVEQAIAELQRVFTRQDGLLYAERYNLLNAFFATIPGNRRFNLRRQWALDSNYADLSFLFTIDIGSPWNPHLEREYLAIFESAHGTPYYLNLHCGDVAHALLLGATGSGKSFALASTLQAVQKYDPLTFVFDLGGSYETLTRVFGGSYLNVGLKNQGFTINPFSLAPTDENLNFLFLFLRVLIESGGRPELTTEEEKTLFAAIERTYKLRAENRTLSNFASLVGPLGERLYRWTRAGQFGHLFDNAEDTLTLARFQTFNFEGWSDYPDLLEPLLFYVLRRASTQIEAGVNAALFKIFVMDEAWIFLRNKTIRDWITQAEKTWRKKNAAMILATQSLNELAASELLGIVNESCPTKIFLANPNIDRRLYAETFHLNDTQLELLESLVPKRELLLVQPHGTKKLVLEVDGLGYWLATNNARDNLRKQEYFTRFGPEQGLIQLARDYPNP